MEKRLYHLHWTNHVLNMKTVFTSLYETQHLTDVTIVCSDGTVYAHRLVLSACSNYFLNLFNDIRSKQTVIILCDVSCNVVRRILTFVYTGQVQVCEVEIGHMLDLAKLLEIRGLYENNVLNQTSHASCPSASHGQLRHSHSPHVPPVGATSATAPSAGPPAATPLIVDQATGTVVKADQPARFIQHSALNHVGQLTAEAGGSSYSLVPMSNFRVAAAAASAPLSPATAYDNNPSKHVAKVLRPIAPSSAYLAPAAAPSYVPADQIATHGINSNCSSLPQSAATGTVVMARPTLVHPSAAHTAQHDWTKVVPVSMLKQSSIIDGGVQQQQQQQQQQQTVNGVDHHQQHSVSGGCSSNGDRPDVSQPPQPPPSIDDLDLFLLNSIPVRSGVCPFCHHQLECAGMPSTSIDAMRALVRAHVLASHVVHENGTTSVGSNVATAAATAVGSQILRPAHVDVNANIGEMQQHVVSATHSGRVGIIRSTPVASTGDASPSDSVSNGTGPASLRCEMCSDLPSGGGAASFASSNELRAHIVATHCVDVTTNDTPNGGTAPPSSAVDGTAATTAAAGTDESASSIVYIDEVTGHTIMADSVPAAKVTKQRNTATCGPTSSDNSKHAAVTSAASTGRSTRRAKLIKAANRPHSNETTPSGDNKVATTESNKRQPLTEAANPMMALSSNGKSYECDECSAKFGRLSHLQRHRRTHTGERPYVCTNCCQSFARQDKLKAHIDKLCLWRAGVPPPTDANGRPLSPGKPIKRKNRKKMLALASGKQAGIASASTGGNASVATKKSGRRMLKQTPTATEQSNSLNGNVSAPTVAKVQQTAPASAVWSGGSFVAATPASGVATAIPSSRTVDASANGIVAFHDGVNSTPSFVMTATAPTMVQHSLSSNTTAFASAPIIPANVGGGGGGGTNLLAQPHIVGSPATAAVTTATVALHPV